MTPNELEMPIRATDRAMDAKYLGYHNGKHHKCELGYSAKWLSYDEHGFTVFGEPQEPCPKPLTNKDYFFADKYYRKK